MWDGFLRDNIEWFQGSYSVVYLSPVREDLRNWNSRARHMVIHADEQGLWDLNGGASGTTWPQGLQRCVSNAVGPSKCLCGGRNKPHQVTLAVYIQAVRLLFI